MAAIHKAGKSTPVVTDIQTTDDGTVRKTVVVEGLMSALEGLDKEEFGAFVPAKYTAESHTITGSGNGLGKLTIQCGPDPAATGADAAPKRTTYKLSMESVTYDLIDHPYLAGVSHICAMWLATDEAERVNDGVYYYKNSTGELIPTGSGPQADFCKAYMAGIKTFNRYYPVLECITSWDNPPGVTKSGNSYTGGGFTKFSTAGTYEAPPLTIPGYPKTNWFKSGDDWTQNEGRDWTRTEQWTYTPESSSSEHAWIYGGGGDNGGDD